MEHLVEEVERVAESGNLKVGLINLLQLFLVQGHRRTTHLYWLLLCQLGLAFMVLLVRGNFWEQAGHVLAQPLGSLQVDFTSVKLPAIGIFLDLNQVNATKVPPPDRVLIETQELMPLFVLEVQVRSPQPPGQVVAR